MWANPRPAAPEPFTFARAHAHGEEVEKMLRAKEMLRAEHAEVETFVEK